jgi:hypothetical protein
MKILFICNSLAEGKDGVGDQTTRLAIECAVNGIAPILMGFSDRNIKDIESYTIQSGIPVYRFPADLALSEREAQLKFIIEANPDIDWISVQFVSYGLDKRGIVRAEIPVFERLLKGFKVHIMFHELWVAEELGAPLKFKILGRVQKRYIVKFLRAINPLIVNTSMPLYKKMLERAGFTVSVLPLFSNIVRAETKVEDFKDKVPAEIYEHHNNYIICCIFGSIYYDSWDMDILLSKLEIEHQRSGKKILVTSIGKLPYGKEFWENLPGKYKNLEFLTFGMQDENFISYWLTHFVNLGIVTTPAIITGKSSSLMAYIDHGIPVFCKKNELAFNFEITEDLFDKRLIQVDESFEFKLVPRVPPKSLIKETTETFIKALNNFK